MPLPTAKKPLAGAGAGFATGPGLLPSAARRWPGRRGAPGGGGPAVGIGAESSIFDFLIIPNSLFSMRKPKLIEDYSALTYDTVSPFAHAAVRQTTSSTFLARGADFVKDLVLALAALDADVAATDHPTPAQTAQRDLLRTATVTELGRLAKRLNLDYPADEPALLSSGLSLAAANGTAATRLPAATAATMEIELTDGAQPGYLLVKMVRPTGTVQILIRYSFDAKLPEDQWSVAVGGGRERQLGPFESGTRISVKAASLTGSTIEPQYSATLSRIVQ